MRTPQESLTASLLRELGLGFREQWLLVVEGERLLFDFLVEERVLLECMECTSNNTDRAWGILRRRLVYLDFKFRLAKETGTFTTVALTEASACPRPRFPFPKTLAHLHSTDHVATTLPGLGVLLIDLMAGNTTAAQHPIAQEMLTRWLASGKETSPSREKRRR